MRPQYYLEQCGREPEQADTRILSLMSVVTSSTFNFFKVQCKVT